MRVVIIRIEFANLSNFGAQWRAASGLYSAQGCSEPGIPNQRDTQSKTRIWIRSMNQSTSSNPVQPTVLNRAARIAKTACFSILVAACSILMIGPQIVLMVPAALLLGVLFVAVRSSWCWVSFGYPLTFGLISAWIGCAEIPNYYYTTGFGLSLGIGLSGLSLIARGFWLMTAADKTSTGTRPSFSSVG